MRALFGWLLGRPFVLPVAWLVRKIRELAYANVEGRYYQYKNNPIDIVDEPNGERWLLVAHVRRSVAGLPDARVLMRIDPDGVRRDRGHGSERIEARALTQLLAKAQDMQTRRFVLWVEREVIYPADKKMSMALRTAFRQSTPRPPDSP